MSDGLEKILGFILVMLVVVKEFERLPLVLKPFFVVPIWVYVKLLLVGLEKDLRLNGF